METDESNGWTIHHVSGLLDTTSTDTISHSLKIPATVVVAFFQSNLESPRGAPNIA